MAIPASKATQNPGSTHAHRQNPSARSVAVRPSGRRMIAQHVRGAFRLSVCRTFTAAAAPCAAAAPPRPSVQAHAQVRMAGVGERMHVSGERTAQGPEATALAHAAAGAGAGPADPADDDAWRANLVTDAADVRAIAGSAATVAVLGIKPESRAEQPGHFVAAYLAGAGVDVIPVPTLYPDVTTILGKPVVRDLRELPHVDILDVFRKPSDVDAHVRDILAMPSRPAVVWLQSGIRAPHAEEALARAGMRVVADRCLLVEHRAAAAASRL